MVLQNGNICKGRFDSLQDLEKYETALKDLFHRVYTNRNQYMEKRRKSNEERQEKTAGGIFKKSAHRCQPASGAISVEFFAKGRASKVGSAESVFGEERTTEEHCTHSRHCELLHLVV